MTETIPDPQIYRAAADVIRENGLHKGGGFYNKSADLPPAKCPVCLFGAINVAAAGEPEAANDAANDAYDWLYRLMSKPFRRSGRLLFHWNDDPERTADDVLALLDRAASAAESARAAQDGGAK